MKSKIPSLFAALLGAAGLATVMAPTASAAVPSTFYCAAATGPGTVCTPYPPAWSTTTVKKIDIAVTNHAAGGERCQLYIDGIGVTSWVYIDPADSSLHYLGTVEGGVGFNLRCQRRAPSGDAGIGGNVYQLSV